jgi:raffinose/stachyose/melibiose transport system substrate-binding protein
MKKGLRILTVAIVAIALPAVAISQQAKPEKITMLLANNVPLDGLKAVAAEVLARYNIQVDFELEPGGAEGDNIIKTRLAAGDMADILNYNSGSLYLALNPSKYFVDLSTEPFMRNVIDSFKSVVSISGHPYAVPTSTLNAGGWLYNKKVYASLGLKVPHTWKELMSNCAKIKAAGKTAVIATYGKDWTAQLVVLSDFYNVQSASPSFAADFTAHKTGFATNPAALRGFEHLRELYDRGFLNPNPATTTLEEGQKMIAEGSGAHYPMLTNQLANIQKLAPDKINDIGFFGQPGDDPAKHGATVWMPNCASISKDSKHIDAAKKFLSFLASPEGVATFVKAQKPSGPFAIKGAAMPDDIPAAVKDILAYIESGKNSPALEYLSPVKGPNLPQICVQTGIALRSPLESAKEYDKDVEKQAKQLGLAGW